MHERVRLLLEASRGSGRFLDKRGVLLGDLIDTGNGLIHLLDAAALLIARLLSVMPVMVEQPGPRLRRRDGRRTSIWPSTIAFRFRAMSP